jgi:hypothetical protein
MTITLTREEAQQVLDALDEYRDSTEDFRVANRCISLIETLRARLSAPEPEPYGYIARRNWKMPVFIEADNVEATGLPYDNADYEPVFKAPPQRKEWQWLTDDEIKEIVGPWGSLPVDGYTRKLFDQIEAKLKGKNHG